MSYFFDRGMGTNELSARLNARPAGFIQDLDALGDRVTQAQMCASRGLAGVKQTQSGLRKRRPFFSKQIRDGSRVRRQPTHPMQKTSNAFLPKSSKVIQSLLFGKKLCNHKTTHRFAASAAVQSKTGNFAHRTPFEARPHRACPKTFL
jgi:hypothetical protein